VKNFIRLLLTVRRLIFISFDIERWSYRETIQIFIRDWSFPKPGAMIG